MSKISLHNFLFSHIVYVFYAYRHCEAPVTASYNFTAEGRIIWVSPIYSWGVPPIIVDFINNVSLRINDKHHTTWCALVVMMLNTYTLINENNIKYDYKLKRNGRAGKRSF